MSMALVMGALVGLLPGLPAMVGLFALFPIFVNWPIEAILLFFSCYICVTQYFGSVSALLFRVPGEGSSIPVLEVSIKLKRFTSVVKAYRVTALTSLIGALLGITLFVAMFLMFRTNWAYLFQTKYIVALLLTLIVLMIMQNKQYLFNIGMLLLGLALAHFSEIPMLNPVCDSVDWLCFLRSPAEATLVLLSLYCVPILFYQTKPMVPTIDQHKMTYDPGWRPFKSFGLLGIKHGLLGFLAGFTPGAGLTLASNLSNSIEQKRNPKKLLSMAGAAEAANNAAAISCTIPFLFLGLPITPSELIIDNFLSGRFYRLNLSTLDKTLSVSGYLIEFTVLLVACMLIVNIISFLLCGHFIKFWRRLMSIDTKIYMAAVKILILASVVTIVISSKISLMPALWTVVLFGGIGTWAMLKNRSIIGLAMMLMIGPFVITKFQLFYYLYF
jgi:putative tricarboxylic transport membrane protein